MNQEIAKVKIFHEQIGAPIEVAPTLLACEAEIAQETAEHLRHTLMLLSKLPQQSGDLLSRLRLAGEELAEWVEAHAAGDIVAAAVAWGDRMYVLLGDAVASGMPADDIFQEVHRSNMTKTASRQDASGKATKGDHFTPPKLSLPSVDADCSTSNEPSRRQGESQVAGNESDRGAEHHDNRPNSHSGR